MLSSVQSVVFDSLWSHGLQHTRFPCPLPRPAAYLNSCTLRQWCHPTISSFVIPFSCLQSFPASESFPMSQFFASGGPKYWSFSFTIRSDQIRSVADSLRLHESQHARPPCPSPTPGVHSDSRPSSPWCHPAISSSVVPFSSCPQSLPTSESFPMSQLFAWGGQTTGVSALASFLPKKSQGWSPLEWTGSGLTG